MAINSFNRIKNRFFTRYTPPGIAPAGFAEYVAGIKHRTTTAHFRNVSQLYMSSLFPIARLTARPITYAIGIDA